jgi:hypothetical protein
MQLPFWGNPSRDPSPIPQDESYGRRYTGLVDDYFRQRGYWLAEEYGPIYMHYRGIAPTRGGGWGAADRPHRDARPMWEYGPAPLVNLPFCPAFRPGVTHVWNPVLARWYYILDPHLRLYQRSDLDHEGELAFHGVVQYTHSHVCDRELTPIMDINAPAQSIPALEADDAP